VDPDLAFFILLRILIKQIRLPTTNDKDQDPASHNYMDEDQASQYDAGSMRALRGPDAQRSRGKPTYLMKNSPDSQHDGSINPDSDTVPTWSVGCFT
jgi:hypothetical protein